MLDQWQPSRMVSSGGADDAGSATPSRRSQSQLVRHQPVIKRYSSPQWICGQLVAYEDWLHGGGTGADKLLNDWQKSYADHVRRQTQLSRTDRTPALLEHGGDKQRLAACASLDDLQRRTAVAPPTPAEQTKNGSKLKGIIQKIKDSVSSSASLSTSRCQPTVSTDWLLGRPSAAKKVDGAPTERAGTPVVNALRRMFSRPPPDFDGRGDCDDRQKDDWLLERSDPTKKAHVVAAQKAAQPITPTTVSALRRMFSRPPAVIASIAPADPPGGDVEVGIASPISDEVVTDQCSTISDIGDMATAAYATNPAYAKRKWMLSRRRVRRRWRIQQSQRGHPAQQRRRNVSAQRHAASFAAVGGRGPCQPCALSGAELVSDWTYLPIPKLSQQQKRERKAQHVNLRNEWDDDLYQVLVDRPRRYLAPPMWDPLIFTPLDQDSRPSDDAAGTLGHKTCRSSKMKKRRTRLITARRPSVHGCSARSRYAERGFYSRCIHAQ